MRRVWVIVSVVAAWSAAVYLLHFFGALVRLDLWEVVTLGLTLVAFYWIAMGAWIRATRPRPKADPEAQ